MEKLLSILKSKKFWTLVTAIVAALSAFFLSSCSVQAKVQREGIHIDTVRVDYIVRSRNFQTIACQSTQIPTSTRLSFRSTPLFDGSTPLLISQLSKRDMLRGPSRTPTPVTPSQFKNVCVRSIITQYPTSTVSNPNCSANLNSPSSAPGNNFGIICLASVLPIGFVRRSRRGGRRGKGRPRPSTKTVTLGGSHL